MPSIQKIVEKVCEARQKVPAQRSVLVAISGIDDCGKAILQQKSLIPYKSN